ncbi:MAG: response regulator [Pseudomonadota bacterium]
MSCIAPDPRRAARQPSPNLLLVDDDPIHQLVGQQLLERLGARVEIAHNGQSALERVGLRHFDLVLMDIHMPLMDGVTATRAIRASGLRKLPIVAMTTRADSDDEREYARAGMNDLVPKPVDARHLARAVARWLPPAPRRPPAPDALEPPIANACGLPHGIPGLDVSTALGRMPGRTALYREMLQRYVSSQARLPLQLREVLARGDLHTAQRIARTARSLAGTVGAIQVQADALALENACAQRRTLAQIQLARQCLEESLHSLIEQLLPQLAQSDGILA